MIGGIKGLSKEELKEKIKQDFQRKIISLFAIDPKEATTYQQYLALG